MTTPDAGTLTLDREAWLRAAVDHFRGLILQVTGVTLPDIRVSMGHGLVNYEKRVRGVTWHHSLDGEGLNQVFISPQIGDTAEVLAVLLHECIHVILDKIETDNPPNADAGEEPKWNHHDAKFAEFATRLGLMKPFTTATPDVPTSASFLVLAAELGPFPHAALMVPEAAVRRQVVDPAGNPVKAPRMTSSGDRQRNRYFVVACPEHGHPFRASRKSLDAGLPDCGVRDESGLKCGMEMVRKD